MGNLKEILENHKKWLFGNGGERANLRDADLRGADLSGANLRHANLSGAKASHTTAGYWLTCPEIGEFTAYKICRHGVIVTLKIPEDAKRSSATTRKCRASKAIVVDIEGNDGKLKEAVSNHDWEFVYRVGETVEVVDYDENRWNECSRGIHFFMSKQEAELW